MMPNHNALNQHPKRAALLECLQDLSVGMLRAATTAMAVRSPITELSLANLAGGCLAFSGTDAPLSRAIGVGTAGTIGEDEVRTVESFYNSRNSAVRVVISERTNPQLPMMLKSRGYQSGDYMQNWWLPLERKIRFTAGEGIEIVAADENQADLWASTVAAGFQEEDTPVDESKIPTNVLDTFFCLGFANGAQPFFAKYKGEIAGGGVLHITGEMASIRTTSCRLQHRNRGIQRALIASRLDAAHRKGCRFAFSSTDRPGASSRNLQRFGFDTLSTSFTMSLPH
jgi:hypothetical protein